jgi:methionine-rich copper-binding protein CopC
VKAARRVLVVLFAAWVFIAALPSSAFAQVVCLDSFPQPNQSLPYAPDRVLLWMSEPVDLAFSTFAVVSRDGTAVSGPARVSADGKRVELPLDRLEPGVYIVRYRATSLATGHPGTGFFLFAIGQSAPSPDQRGALGALAPWASAAAGVVLAGLAVVRWRTGRVSIERWLPLAALATVLMALWNWGSHATATIGAPLSTVAATEMVWPLLGGTPTGWSLLMQSGAAAILATPTAGRAGLLRAALSVWFTIAVAFTALSGGPLKMSGSTHLAPMLLLLAAYGVATVVGAVIVSQIQGVRPRHVGWADLVCAALILTGVLLAV